MLALLLAAAATARAVNPDNAAPCWRDATNTTRQMWTFNVTNSFNTPLAPEFKTNQPGNPTATMFNGGLGHGYYNTLCAEGLGGCDAVFTAVLPLITSGVDTNTEAPANWDQGSPYESIQYGTGGYPFNAPTNNPPALGTAQGYWDLGQAGCKMVLAITNNGAPAGTQRYFFFQGTYGDLDVATRPNLWGVTNSAGVGNTNRVGTIANTLMEQALDNTGAKAQGGGRWFNQRVVMRVAADTAAGTDTVTIINTNKSFWVDAIIVETLDRVAQADALNAPANTSSNIPYGQLLANDRGGILTGVSTPVNCTVTTNGSSVVFNPTFAGAGTATFVYTNRDCTGYTNLTAQVTVTVGTANSPPAANPDNYTRPKGASLKIKISDLVTNDTDADLNGLTVTNITLTTTNGATLQTNGTMIVYTNSFTADANDRFSYIITDGQGGSATGQVFITVTGAVAGQTSGSIAVSGGQVNLTFYGIPGTAYQVQRSTNGTGGPWLTFATNTANPFGTPPVGQISLTDNFTGVVPVPSSAFYRLFLP